MDRNHTMQVVIVIVETVALRKESVDRNHTMQVVIVIVETVALRKESVDRNLYYGDDLTFSDVALRKESVDRNKALIVLTEQLNRSLSARRAWIEIQVAHQRVCHSGCRSPQGERG